MMRNFRIQDDIRKIMNPELEIFPISLRIRKNNENFSEKKKLKKQCILGIINKTDTMFLHIGTIKSSYKILIATVEILR